jgi:hypothetical protein
MDDVLSIGEFFVDFVCMAPSLGKTAMESIPEFVAPVVLVGSLLLLAVAVAGDVAPCSMTAFAST